jgi:anthranilate synthase/aminodeoxychorismate synthase-like glutamine amidotransferase
VRVLIVDNVDSFVHNLYQYVGELGAEPVVVRDRELLGRVDPSDFDRIIISPGPGHPANCVGGRFVLEGPAREIPTLGVCLGHQLIGLVFGARIVHAPRIVHGETSTITHDGQGVFAGLAQPLVATRYHSLAIDPTSVPPDLVVTSWSEDGVIMGVRHRRWPIEGIQFHPESYATRLGHAMLGRFLGLPTSVFEPEPAAG